MIIALFWEGEKQHERHTCIGYKSRSLDLLKHFFCSIEDESISDACRKSALILQEKGMQTALVKVFNILN